MGVMIEYAYLHPAPVVSVPVGCVVSQISSRMCERGTKGCVVEHEAQAVSHPPTDVVRELVEALDIAVCQNSHDMVMTGEELRRCEAALKSAKEHGL